MVFKKKGVVPKKEFPVTIDDNCDVTFSEPTVSSASVGKHDENLEGNKSVQPLIESANSSLGTNHESTDIPSRSNPDARVIPAWYMFFKRAAVKKHIIKQRLDEYSAPVSAGGIKHRPSFDEVKDYHSKLKSLTLKELLLMGSLKKYDLKLDVLDRLKSIKKKKHAVVTIFNDNKTTDTGVIHCYDRTFTRHKMNYLVMSERGIYDPEFRMMHFYYFANNPFPLKMDKYPLNPDIMDASLQDSVIEAKVIEALANIDMSKVVNLILIIGIISFILQLVTLLVTLRGFKII